MTVDSPSGFPFLKNALDNSLYTTAVNEPIVCFVVQLLVAHGAPLFIENLAKETPCDCAEKSGHGEIALYLESKMVFSVS